MTGGGHDEHESSALFGTLCAQGDVRRTGTTGEASGWSRAQGVPVLVHASDPVAGDLGDDALLDSPLNYPLNDAGDRWGPWTSTGAPPESSTRPSWRPASRPALRSATP